MTKTSIGVQELRKRIAEKAKADPRHRFWGLYTHVWKLDLLGEAYRLAKTNNGAPGVDGESFSEIEAGGVGEFLAKLSQELREKTYQPLPCRPISIPKEKGRRLLQIPAIRDRVVQGALKLVLEPIFEANFQPGSFGLRPNRSAHQALEHIRYGLNKRLHQVIDLDIKSYYDNVRHHLLLSKIAERVQDDDIMWLCKRILKSGGKRGIPQGSVIGPLWSNVYLNDVDRMLERAQSDARRGPYDNVQYARYGDDIVVLVSDHPTQLARVQEMERALREELEKLDLSISDEKSSVVNVTKGETFNFLGYTFRWVPSRTKPGKMMALARPQKKRRTRFLRKLKVTLRKHRHVPVAKVVREIVNPRVRGWVNYFRWGNAGSDLQYVAWQIDTAIRRFATRQRPKRRGGRSWTKWRHQEIYDEWGLFNDYRVAWCQRGPKGCVS